jgi:molecular chaperone IbpA
MRTFDFAPLYRSTVGFDQLFSMLDQVGGAESAAAPGYPPYNIKRSGENAYNISVAVAGFAGADLSIEVKENVLTIRGNKQSSSEEESDLIYQGIAERNFERKFQLADHVQIKGARPGERAAAGRPLTGGPRGDEAPGDSHNDRQEGRP